MIHTKPQVRQLTEEIEFKTELSPIKEAQFKVWYRNMANNLGLAPDPDDPLHYYDYRGYWEENPTEILKAGDHFIDKFKTPGHPTFSDQSKYSYQKGGSNIQGGTWDGKYFVHSRDTDQHADRTEEYLEGTGEMPVYEGGTLEEVEVYPESYAQGGQVSQAKAKEILSHGTIRGKAITDKQKRYFGFIAGGGTPKYQQSAMVTNDPPPEVTTEVVADDMVISPDDKILSNMKELITEEGSEKWDRLNKHFYEIHKPDPKSLKTKGCVEGSLNCNQYYSRYVSAPSIRDISNKKLSHVIGKYDLPSEVKNSETYEMARNKSLDAWELAEAYAGEGAGKLLYDRTRDDISVLKDLIESGNMPFGAMVMQGYPDEYNYIQQPLRDSEGNVLYNEYTGDMMLENQEFIDNLGDTYSEGASSHGTSVMGWTPEGKPILYDYGKAAMIDNSMYTQWPRGLSGINKVMVPNEYAKYTFNNVNRANQLAANAYQEEAGRSFVPDENATGYINDINKGLHIAGPKVKEEFELSDSVLKKLKDRVIGIAGQETNFGNYGDEDVSIIRQLAIEGESELTNEYLKPLAKKAKNLYNEYMGSREEGGMPDWAVEVLAYNENKEAGGNSEEFKELYKKRRAEIPKPKGISETDNPSVGPLAIKSLSDFTRYNLGISKENLYGPAVADADEFSKSSQAALVHLAEDFTRLKKHYDEIYKGDDKLTNNQLIDLATIAYNNPGKAFDETFIDFYIKEKNLPDDYLEKVKGLAKKYKTTDGTQASLERGGKVQKYQQSDWVGKAKKSTEEMKYVGEDLYEPRYSLPPFTVEADRKPYTPYMRMGVPMTQDQKDYVNSPNYKPFSKHMGEGLLSMVTEPSGLASAVRIAQDPVGTAKGIGNTALSVAQMANPIGAGYEIYKGATEDDYIPFISGQNIMGEDKWSGVPQTLDAAMMIPYGQIGAKAARPLLQGAKSQAWRINPNAMGNIGNRFQAGENFRYINKEGIDDILSTGKMRSKGGSPQTHWTTGRPNPKYATGDNTNLIRMQPEANVQMLPAEGGKLAEALKGASKRVDEIVRDRPNTSPFFGDPITYPKGTDVLPRQSFKIGTEMDNAGNMYHTFKDASQTGYPLQYDPNTMQMLKPHWWERFKPIHQDKSIPRDLNKLGEIDRARFSYGVGEGSHYIGRGPQQRAVFEDWYGGNLDDEGLITVQRYVNEFPGIAQLASGQTKLNPRGLSPGLGSSSGGYSLTENQLVELLNKFSTMGPKQASMYKGGRSHDPAWAAWLKDVLKKHRAGEDITSDIVRLQHITGKGSHAPQILGQGQNPIYADPLMSWTGDISGGARTWLEKNKWIFENPGAVYQIESKFNPNTIYRTGQLKGGKFDPGAYGVSESEWTSVGALNKSIVPELKGTEGFTMKKVAELIGKGEVQYMDDATTIFPETSFNKLNMAKSELKDLQGLKQTPLIKKKVARLEKNVKDLTKEVETSGRKGEYNISDALFKNIIGRDVNLAGTPFNTKFGAEGVARIPKK